MIIPSKYTLLGFSLIILISFITWEFLKPKEGISTALFDVKNIDSAQIYNSVSRKSITVINKEDLNKISIQLQKLKKINPDRTNINTSFVELIFFTNSERSITVRIMNNAFNGILIHTNDLFYKNDSLYTVVTTFLNPN